MPIARSTIMVSPAGKAALQAAIDLAGLGGLVSETSWTAFPNAQTPALFFVGAQFDEAAVVSLETICNAHAPTTRYWRGPRRQSEFLAAMTEAQLLAAFPLANSGPVPVPPLPALPPILTQRAAQAGFYRDMGLGPRPDDGAPGAAPVQGA
jgi:hypothetical protein